MTDRPPTPVEGMLREAKGEEAGGAEEGVVGPRETLDEK